MASVSVLKERLAKAMALGLRSSIAAHQRPVSASGTTLLTGPISRAFFSPTMRAR